MPPGEIPAGGEQFRAAGHKQSRREEKISRRHPQPAEAGSPLREGAIVYKREKQSDVPRSHNAPTWGKHPTQAQAAQPPKSAPAAKPPQQHPAGYTHPRETKAKHPAQTQGHSHPNTPRRQSRRSSTQPDNRTNARRRPSTQSKPQRRSHPNAHRRQSRRSSTQPDIRTHAKLRAPASASGRIIPPNANPRAQTTRTRQRRAAQAAQTAVGDAQ